MSGQCQRYTEYETSPNHCTPGTRYHSMWLCAAMTRTAPSTGTAACQPGNGVRLV